MTSLWYRNIRHQLNGEIVTVVRVQPATSVYFIGRRWRYVHLGLAVRSGSQIRSNREKNKHSYGIASADVRYNILDTSSNVYSMATQQPSAYVARYRCCGFFIYLTPRAIIINNDNNNSISYRHRHQLLKIYHQGQRENAVETKSALSVLVFGLVWLETRIRRI